MKNSIYWSFNLPLQLWPKENSKDLSDISVLNYVPRNNAVYETELDELIGDQTREEFLETAALHFENLAKLFRKAINDPERCVYYPSEDLVIK